MTAEGSQSSSLESLDVYGRFSSAGISTATIEHELSKLKEIQLTDLESDFPLNEASPHRYKPSAQSSRRRRGKCLGSKDGRSISGYLSESESKLKTAASYASSRGYHSEDESRSALRGDAGKELIETTARVISVEERQSPCSDLGDSFHEDDSHFLPYPLRQKHEYARLETPAPPHGPSSRQRPTGSSHLDADRLRDAAKKVLVRPQSGGPPNNQYYYSSPTSSEGYMRPRVYPPSQSGIYRPHLNPSSSLLPYKDDPQPASLI